MVQAWSTRVLGYLFMQLTRLTSNRLRSRWRARCVPDGPGNQGTWRTLADRGNATRAAAMLVTALPALIPKLIVRSDRAGPTAGHTHATARRIPGALRATRAQSEQSMTCEHTGCSRQ